jgi:hypothetical protein
MPVSPCHSLSRRLFLFLSVSLSLYHLFTYSLNECVVCTATYLLSLPYSNWGHDVTIPGFTLAALHRRVKPSPPLGIETLETPPAQERIIYHMWSQVRRGVAHPRWQARRDAPRTLPRTTDARRGTPLSPRERGVSGGTTLRGSRTQLSVQRHPPPSRRKNLPPLHNRREGKDLLTEGPQQYGSQHTKRDPLPSDE